jgi:predicted AAA+ superfamily ATPase
MVKTHRYLFSSISKDLEKKMVFIGGPRQIGKTTLSLQFFKNKASEKNTGYLNWDYLADRSLILKNQLPLTEPLLIFDEIHKYRNWRSLMKGLFDKYKNSIQFIVTGSARLDHFRKGGDSLLGRYHYYRLHPLSLMELSKTPSNQDLQDLLTYSGFPEPFFEKDKTFLRRWQKERVQKVVYEDLRDLETVKEISLIELLVETLPSKVGSPLSLKNLAVDLQVSQPTIARWVTILDNLYLTFRISPYGAPKIRAVKKEQKIYFWDWTQNDEMGPKFENLVASQLLKYCHYLEDTEGHKMELRFLRDTDKREIDFVVLQNKKPLFAVECKTGERVLSNHIKYFSERTNIPAFYQVHQGQKDYGKEKSGRVLPFVKFCKELGLP